jgi:antitoxin (DNA-binding transcriptional repressor) of toxin-antitoxin stability system
MQISKSKFKARALEFFRRVEETGEPLVVTDHGKPKLEIRLYRSPAEDPLKALKGSVTSYVDPLEPVGDEDWSALK